MKAIEDRHEAMEENIPNNRINYFIRRWAPANDLDERANFELDLINLVRTLYSDANKPMERALRQALSSMAVAMPKITPKED